MRGPESGQRLPRSLVPHRLLLDGAEESAALAVAHLDAQPVAWARIRRRQRRD